MSIRVMTAVWEKSEQKGSSLLLLLALADFSNDEGLCWPAIKTLAKKVRMSERHTKRLLSELQEDEEIASKERHNSMGLQTSNYYLLADKYHRGDNLSPPHDITMSPLGVTRMSPNPSKNSERIGVILR